MHSVVPCPCLLSPSGSSTGVDPRRIPGIFALQKLRTGFFFPQQKRLKKINYWSDPTDPKMLKEISRNDELVYFVTPIYPNAYPNG